MKVGYSRKKFKQDVEGRGGWGLGAGVGVGGGGSKHGVFTGIE